MELATEFTGLADGRDPAVLESFPIPQGIADPEWRLRMNRGAIMPTQDVAGALIAEGHTGLAVPSSARGGRGPIA